MLFNRFCLGLFACFAFGVQSCGAAGSTATSAKDGVDWSGFHVGIAVGAGTKNNQLTVPVLAGFTFEGIGGEGVLAELTAGYDYLVSPRVVVGMLGGVRLGNMRTRLTVPAGPFEAAITADYGYDVAGRIGFLVTPQTMAYGLLGYSRQHFEITATGIGTIYDWHAEGAVFGLGLESALTPYMTLKSEYRYTEYSADDFSSGGFINIRPAFHTFRLGLNYRLGMPVGQSAGFEAPGYDWTGFHAGLSVGAGGLVHEVSVSPLAGLEFNGIGADGVFSELSVGYDREISERWVLGVSGVARYSGISTVLSVPGVGVEASVDADYGFDVLARAGYKLSESSIVYMIGGYSWQHFEIDISGFGSIYDWSSGGYTIGGGIETALTEKTVINLEYRFSEYSGEDFGLPGLIDLSPSSHTVRAGLKVKLD